jgi:hypothetical protein
VIFGSPAAGNLGIDWDALYQTGKDAAESLVTKDLPSAVTKTITQKATTVATPFVTQAAQNKASNVAAKGQVAMWTGIGGGIGLLLGALIAGGSWQRRAVGGGVAGLVGAAGGALASTKIGLLIDSA